MSKAAWQRGCYVLILLRVNAANATILQLRAMSQFMTAQGRKALNLLGSGGVCTFTGRGNIGVMEAARLAQNTVTKKGLYVRGALAISGVRQ